MQMSVLRSGELLNAERIKKKLTLEQVEKATKIRKKFLDAIEKGNYKSVSHSYARGFVKNYAEYLGLDTSFILALFRRETSTSEEAVLPKGVVFENSILRMTPQRGVLLGVVAIALFISVYIFQQYKEFISAPVLTVDVPKNEQIITEGDLEVKGKTNSDSTVSINSNPITVDQNGQFSKRITVFKGEMTITITAKNRQGKETVVYRHIFVK